ncbi:MULTISPECIES: (Fe-S)-binding protein [Allobacillus]|uniref:Glycolate oxidase iron-sulfur subunit n=1 Tax=Allobacillus salarius TaxID=1955272 RepID=A0A556P6R8_9BACI|nr:(Fe-S)-binding protein [Allobacillus salarius]TSJ60089.1 (Fe-S)-binding protein [Allobacillus salarius]
MAEAQLHVRIQEGFQQEVEEEKLLDCMRCGFCLPACPTYLHSNFDETQSPRGRIALMKAVRDGMLPFDDSIEESLDLCLGCRACEPACPAGVEYGSLLESARNVIQREKKHSVKEKAARYGAFKHLFRNQRTMERATGFIRFYQKSGIQALTRKTGILSLFPSIMKDMEAILPILDKSRIKKGHTYESTKRTTKIAFFTGCMMDTIFSQTNQSTVKLLQQLGCDVWVPENQVCCGALQGHSGELDLARENAIRNIEAFLAQDVDYIVNNAGGCGAFLSEYDHLLKDHPELLEKAKAFSEKTIDISTLIEKLGVTGRSLKLKDGRQAILTYQDSCHLRNVNRVVDEPRAIMQSIDGATYVELPTADQCCGSAGIYNLIHTEMSMRILDSKMDDVKATEAQFLLTSNPGCLLQMKLGIEKAGLSDQMEAMHLVDFLAEYVDVE